MRSYAVVCAVVLATPLFAQDSTGLVRLLATGSSAAGPRVLQDSEPVDNLVLTLPGAPAPQALPELAPPDSGDDHRPLLRRAPKPILPAEFERESAVFTQKMIGLWAQPDAFNLFGDALRERPVFDDDGAENGRVFAYSDPTGRYREIELDFAKDSGTLRTVFVYPWKMTGQECRRLWGGNVQSTDANKGRRFYSYANRRLDVLVDPSGNVISLGLY